MRPNRQRVMGDLCDLTDAALLAVVDRVLLHDPDAVKEVVSPLTKPPPHVQNVAERLRTGRLAELFFLEHSLKIVDVPPPRILDHRSLARGYDFGVEDREDIAIEVKGLKQSQGGIVFTDREWSEASARRADYWLVVVGRLESDPLASLIRDPSSKIQAKCRCQTTIAASWHATVAVA